MPSQLADHQVQFYHDDSFLAQTVSTFADEGFQAGERVILIATAPHLAVIERHLVDAGHKPPLLREMERFVTLDVEATLATFMRDGRPDPERFKAAVGSRVARMANHGGRLRAFGEMVAHLWVGGNQAAALELEELWNALQREFPFQLLCGYPLEGCGSSAQAGEFARVCAAHTSVLPAESLGDSRGMSPQQRSAVAVLQQKAASLENEMLDRRTIEQVLREKTRALEMLAHVGSTLVAESELEKIIETITAAGRELSGAAFGAFLSASRDEHAAAHALSTFFGAPREAFASFPMSLFEGNGVVRIADVQADPRYAQLAPRQGKRGDPLPVRSYLVVPVTSRSGEVFGSLFFGHAEPGMFSANVETLIVALASQAAIAMDNARLYSALQRDLAVSQKAAENNGMLAAIIESSDDAIISKDLNGVVHSWNAGAEHIFGYTPEEMIGQSITRVIPTERLHEEPTILKRMRAGERICNFETIRRHKSGRLFDVSLTVSPIRDGDGHIIGVSKIARDITERKLAQVALQQAHSELEQRVAERTAELSQRNGQLARLASELITTEQRERRRLAGLLHDHLQQLLVAALFRLRHFARRLHEGDRIACDRVVELLDESLKTSRSLTVDLSPPILHEGGLIAGLEWLLRDMQEKHGLTVAFTPDPAADLGADSDRAEVRMLFFECARELLFNTVKHAQTTTAALELTASSGVLKLTVRDGGIGFNPAVLNAETGGLEHFGLVSIRERLAMFGGHLKISSAPGRGARFDISVPFAVLAPEAAAGQAVPPAAAQGALA